MTKKKILVLSDHPLSPSGVGSQTKYMIDALLKTGRYKFICLGGAVKHQSYEPLKVAPWNDDFMIYPIDGYGNHEMIRSVMQKEKPDALWFMTDPRFYEWLWEIENEVRANIPMIYYHVWDNFPAPHFNGRFYRSTDEILCISKVTYECVKQVMPDKHDFIRYLPHAVNDSIFKAPSSPEEHTRVKEVRDNIINTSVNFTDPNKKIFFWNSRNARRKQSGTLVWWFKEWLDKVGHDKATLLMHTDPRDPHGQDLPHIIEHLGITDAQVLISTQKVSQEQMAAMYAAADYTIGISDAEGFGLSTLESLSCGTPIIVNMTGGLQEQVTDGKNWFGWGIQPSSKSVIGSLTVPYIYEDRISQEDFSKTLDKALGLNKAKYKNLSALGLKHIKDNYNFNKFEKRWVDTMDEIIEKHGSWEDRELYKKWHFMEVA